MRPIPITIRLTFSLVSLTISGLLLAATLGLIPDTGNALMKGRAELCESIAIGHSLLAIRSDVTAMKAGLEAIKRRNSDILSIAVRRTAGELEFEIGEHSSNWHATADDLSSETQMLVPITNGERSWGTVEVRFVPIRLSGWEGLLQEPLLRLVEIGRAHV